jgi:hypothetical protein
VEEKASIIIVDLGFQVYHEPVPWAETVVGECSERRWPGDGRSPAGANGPHVHVRIDATGGGEDAVGNSFDKLRWKRSPF